MKHKHSNNSRIIKRTLVIIPSAALLVGFTLAQTTLPPPAQPSPSPAPSAQTTTSSATPSTASPSPQTVASPQPPKKQSHPGKRDLSLYDKALPLTLSKTASKQERESGMSQIRGFLLSHWQGKHHGYAQTSFFNPEGNQVASTFFVEPDADGQWVVTLESSTGATETFHVVEQIEAPDDGPPSLGHGNRGIKGGTHTGLHLKQNEKSNSGLIL
jgi:hypothetical protein